MTEEFMEFKGFDINTAEGIKKAIKWLKSATGNDMFFSEADSEDYASNPFEVIAGEFRRDAMIDYLKRLSSQ